MVTKEFGDIAGETLEGPPDARTQVARSATEFTRLYFKNDAEVRGNIIDALSAMPDAEIEKLAAATPVQRYSAFAEQAVELEAAAVLSSPTADDPYKAHRSNPINLLKGVFGSVAQVETEHHRSVVEARIADFARETSLDAADVEITTRVLTEQLDKMAASSDPASLKKMAEQNRRDSYDTLNGMMVGHYDAERAARAAEQNNRNTITTPNGQKWEIM